MGLIANCTLQVRSNPYRSPSWSRGRYFTRENGFKGSDFTTLFFCDSDDTSKTVVCPPRSASVRQSQVNCSRPTGLQLTLSAWPSRPPREDGTEKRCFQRCYITSPYSCDIHRVYLRYILIVSANSYIYYKFVSARVLTVLALPWNKGTLFFFP